MRASIPNGNTDTSLNDMFRNGTFVLVKGRHIHEGDAKKVLISDDLAQRNGFQIGDTLTVECKTGFPVDSDSLMDTIGEPVPLEIVGLFHSSFYREPSNLTPEADYPENFLFMDLNTAALLAKNYYDFFYETDLTHSRYDNVTFFVENPSELDAVIERVKSQSVIDWSDYKLEKDDTAYRASIAPINSIRGFSTGLTAAVVIGGAVILSLVMTMWMKGRKHEIGIMVSVGIQKTAIVAQRILECVYILIIAFVLLFCVSAPIVNGIGSVANELNATETSESNFSVSGGVGKPVVIDKITIELPVMDYSATAKDFILVFAICTGITCISTGISSVKALRKKKTKEFF